MKDQHSGRKWTDCVHSW